MIAWASMNRFEVDDFDGRLWKGKTPHADGLSDYGILPLPTWNLEDLGRSSP